MAYINMAHSMNITCFEVPFSSHGTEEDLPIGEIFSVHAPKDLLERNIASMPGSLSELKAFCEKVQCSRIVFHPNPDIETDDHCFKVISELLPGFVICMENTISGLDELVSLLSVYGFRITWDVAHAAFHRHEVCNVIDMVEYFHVRGFSEGRRYITLKHSEKDGIIPYKENVVYMLEYPYENMYELLMDWKFLNQEGDMLYAGRKTGCAV